MAPVRLDPALIAELTANAGAAVPLAGPDGRPVGFVVSPDEYAAMLKARCDRAWAEVSEADCRRALADPRRHTMPEVLGLLGAE